MSDDRKSSLGEFLKSEREKRGLTIEQTSSATKIGLKILKQLEADQYSELPALPFVRGFIRNYGKFLGIDGEKLLVEYASFLDEHSRERPKRDAGHSGYAFERPEGEQSRKILWGVMAGMLFFGGIVVFVFKPSLKHKHHGHVDKLKASPGPDDEGMEGVVLPEVSPTPSPGVSGVPLVDPSGLPSTAPSGVPSAHLSPVPTSTPTPSAKPSPTSTPAPFIPPKVPLVLAPPEEPKPSPKPKHTPSPVVTASPTSEPSPGATPSVSPSATPEDDFAKDKLQSGANYTAKEIKYKVVFRTKADVWVRYQCDDKKLMKFALKKDKILVLRGKSTVWFQTSNAASVTFALGSGKQTALSESDRTFDYVGNPTLVWPAEARESIQEKFKVGKPLPTTDAPVDSTIAAPEAPPAT